MSQDGRERYYEIQYMVNIAMRRTLICGLPKPGDQDYVLWQQCRQFHGDDEVAYEALKATILQHESADGKTLRFRNKGVEAFNKTCRKRFACNTVNVNL